MSNKIGILVVNLGTPDSPTPKAIRRYLAEFLTDRHVVDLNPLLWYPLLYGIILPKRSKRIAQNYQSIWTDQGSPLLKYSQSLTQLIAKNMMDIPCEMAMTYGNPSLSDALKKLNHCHRIIVLPLFPQFSTTTTGAIQDRIASILSDWQVKPQISCISNYADDPGYIRALTHQIQQSFEKQGTPDTLLLSFHGIPIRYIQERQDCYVTQCELTYQRLKESLCEYHISVDLQMSFQSKFGRGKWTEPNTTDVLQTLAQQGKTKVFVMCPGFAVDCIETIDEIDEFNQHQFLNAGGREFYYIPALNDSPEQVEFMSELINREIT